MRGRGRACLDSFSSLARVGMRSRQSAALRWPGTSAKHGSGRSREERRGHTRKDGPEGRIYCCWKAPVGSLSKSEEVVAILHRDDSARVRRKKRGH